MLVSAWAGSVRAHAAFIVNTTADIDDGSCELAPDGDCSLREAIQAANAFLNDHPDAPDSVVFDFGDGAVPPFTIVLDSPLPTITEGLILDGRSEPRFILSREHVPVIIIDGGGFDQVFRVRAPNTLIVSLALTNAAISGIDAEDADFLLVRGCYFGIDPDTGVRLGGDPQEPAFGSHAIRVSASYRPRIGGDGELAGNIIAGSGAEAVAIEGGDDLVLIGNRIGVDPAGREARPNCLDEPTAFAVAIDGAESAEIIDNVIAANSGAGLRLLNTPSALVAQNHIGVDETGRVGLGNASSGVHLEGDIDGLLLQGNVIAANGGDGVACATDATGQWMMSSNVIGVDAAQSQVLPNLGDGVAIASGCEGAVVGTIGLGQGNVIAHNQGAGVRMPEGISTVRGNSIFLNGELGIDAGERGVTANDIDDAALPVNFPQVREIGQAGGNLEIHGCTVGSATIDIYEASPDPSGFGEGMRHLGAIIEGGALDGDDATECSSENGAAFSIALETDATAVTLTATHRGRTSEFSLVYSEADVEPDPGCDDDSSCEAPSPICNTVLRRCEVCIDDAEGDQLDSGCSQEAPRCALLAGDVYSCSLATEPPPGEGEPGPAGSGGCSTARRGSGEPSNLGMILILMGLLTLGRSKK